MRSNMFLIASCLCLIALMLWQPIVAQEPLVLELPYGMDYYNPAHYRQGQYVDVWTRYQFENGNYSQPSNVGRGLSVPEALQVGAAYSGFREASRPMGSETGTHHYGAMFRYSGLSFARLYQFEGRYAYEWILQGGKHRVILGGAASLIIAPYTWDNTYSVTALPDLHVGLTYRYKGFTLDVSLRNVIGDAIADSSTILMRERKGYLGWSYEAWVADKVAFIPHMLMAYGERTSQFELGLMLNIMRYVEVGYTFRAVKVGHIFQLGLPIYKGLRFDAAYEFSQVVSRHNIQLSLTYQW